MTSLPHQSRTGTDSPPLDGAGPVFVDRELRYQHQSEQRIRALEMLVDAKLATVRVIVDLQAEKSVAALAASDKAILKAESAVEKRFESVNEFRQALSDQTSSFVSRVEFESLRETSAARIADLSSRLDKIEGKAVGLNAGWIYLLGALSVIGTVLSVVLAIALPDH